MAFLPPLVTLSPPCPALPHNSPLGTASHRYVACACVPLCSLRFRNTCVDYGVPQPVSCAQLTQRAEARGVLFQSLPRCCWMLSHFHMFECLFVCELQGPVTVVMLNSELSVNPGDPQYAFIQTTLAAVDRTVTPWCKSHNACTRLCDCLLLDYAVAYCASDVKRVSVSVLYHTCVMCVCVQ